MSYILEALKKSDKERQYQPSSLPLKELAPLASRKRRSNTPLIIFITILTTGLTMASIFWLTKNYSLAPVSEPQESIATQEAVTQKPAETPQQTAPPSVVPIEPEIIEPTPIYDFSVSGEVITSSEQLATLPPKYPDLIHMSELPVDILSKLPKLNFAGHAYSQTPEDRLIIINNRIVKEGNLITDHLLLKEITPEGLVLSYKTINFQVMITP